jgi:hypothetical protein
MESVLLLLLILLIIITLTCLSYKSEKKKYQNKLKETFICKNPKYRKHQKVNYIKPEQIFKEDEDINFQLENPVKEKIIKPFEMLGWRNFYNSTYGKSEVKPDKNFEGTIFRNYLDNMNFFKN